MNDAHHADQAEFDPLAITRPDPVLLRYYACIALLTAPGFPFVFLPLYFKFLTLEYKFDQDGVSMRWGLLFRREVHLTYRRIQDIHLTRNLLQRWMGLATVAIQTASGSSGPEMSIEGIPQAEALRDFLYSKMRGARGQKDPSAVSGPTTSGPAISGPATAGLPDDETADDEALQLLREIRDALKSQAAPRVEPANADGSSQETTS